jgi:hypothetical protein
MSLYCLMTAQRDSWRMNDVGRDLCLLLEDCGTSGAAADGDTWCCPLGCDCVWTCRWQELTVAIFVRSCWKYLLHFASDCILIGRIIVTQQILFLWLTQTVARVAFCAVLQIGYVLKLRRFSREGCDFISCYNGHCITLIHHRTYKNNSLFCFLYWLGLISS